MERLGACFKYDTKHPVINATERSINYHFMAAEAAYILYGRNDISYLSKILPHFDKYSDDGHYQSGAYGPPVVDQLPYVVQNLNEDALSRQAVLTIWRPRPGPSKDIPCTVSMQFLVRDKELHTIVNMRSSDIFKGLIYDTFCFAAISSVVANFTGWPLGTTRVFAGSSHLYDADKTRAVNLIANPGTISGMYTPFGAYDPDYLITWLERIVYNKYALNELLNPPADGMTK